MCWSIPTSALDELIQDDTYIMYLHCEAKVSNCCIKSCDRSWSAHEVSIFAHTKATLRNNSLSSHSCHFAKMIFRPNSFMHMFNVSTLRRQSIKLPDQRYSTSWSDLCIYKFHIRGKLSQFPSCFFFKSNYFMHMSNVSIVQAKYQIAPPKALVGVDRLVHTLS